MITLTREEAQQVLDALVDAAWCVQHNNLPPDDGNDWDKEIELLRARLAKPYRQQADAVFAETNGRMTIDPVTGDVGIGWASGPEKNGGE